MGSVKSPRHEGESRLRALPPIEKLQDSVYDVEDWRQIGWQRDFTRPFRGGFFFTTIDQECNSKNRD